MTAQNHAITGAAIGLLVANPAIALPVALLSHFVCDVIPHYDLPEKDETKRIGSKRFLYEQILSAAGICLLIVLYLALTRPSHWLVACIAAFLAASPDLLWIPRFLLVKRTGTDTNMQKANWFLKFHVAIQWKTGPNLLLLETTWFGLFTGFILARS